MWSDIILVNREEVVVLKDANWQLTRGEVLDEFQVGEDDQKKEHGDTTETCSKHFYKIDELRYNVNGQTGGFTRDVALKILNLFRSESCRSKANLTISKHVEPLVGFIERQRNKA